ncbi:MAG: hypothetical protein K1X35_07615 [Caulobacteraceae bacterium]|nr:hypothetical protein [Caulobacteraceae bacterium]
MDAPVDGVGDHRVRGPIRGPAREGRLQGGSVIGRGECVRKAGAAAPITHRLTGYLTVRADSLEAAKSLVAGNPDYEPGGAVEVRDLPVTD